MLQSESYFNKSTNDKNQDGLSVEEFPFAKEIPFNFRKL